MADRDRAIVVRAGEGRSLALGPGLQLCFKADDPESEGRYAISIATVAGGHLGTSPHIHAAHDDVSFVIEGSLAFEVGEETFEAPAGTLVVVPGGLAHRWWNPSSKPATLMNLHVPGFGFESFVRELSGLSAEGRASPAAMAELGARHDVFFDRQALDERHPG